MFHHCKKSFDMETRPDIVKSPARKKCVLPIHARPERSSSSISSSSSSSDSTTFDSSSSEEDDHSTRVGLLFEELCTGFKQEEKKRKKKKKKKKKRRRKKKKKPEKKRKRVDQTDGKVGETTTLGRMMGSRHMAPDDSMLTGPPQLKRHDGGSLEQGAYKEEESRKIARPATRTTNLRRDDDVVTAMSSDRQGDLGSTRKSDHHKAFMMDMYNIDATLPFEEAVSNYVPPPGCKSLSPKDWKFGFHVVANWETGDQNHTVKQFRRKYKRGYNWVKEYSVDVRIDGTKVLWRIPKQGNLANDNQPLLLVAHINQVFHAIEEAHTGSCHLSATPTTALLQKKYFNITLAEVKCFIDLCCSCARTRKMKAEKFVGAVKPIRSNAFRERFQMDLIDYSADPQKNVYGVVMTKLLVVKNHFTRLTFMVPLPGKETEFVAWELYCFFSFVGHPLIVQTDNGTEFVGRKVIQQLYELCPFVTKVLQNDKTKESGR